MSGRAERRPGTLDDSGPAVRRLITNWEVVGLGVDSPTFQSKEAAEDWLARKLARLPANRRPRERNCLCCREMFLSDGAHHRLCNSCRQKDAGPLYSRQSVPERRLRGVA